VLGKKRGCSPLGAKSGILQDDLGRFRENISFKICDLDDIVLLLTQISTDMYVDTTYMVKFLT
jgi:hypothetical protein